MFGFADMIGNYEMRKVERFDEGDLSVSTCRVTDSIKPYETAVSHPQYNAGTWVIVALYDTEEEAREGHDKWVDLMTAEELPAELRDVSGAEIALLVDAFAGEEDWRTHKRQS